MTIAKFKKPLNSTKTKTRKGRGNAAGKGGECGRGHKGQKSRSGYSRRAGFEGGQMPLYKRLPKLKGFKSLSNEVFDVINVATLDALFNNGEEVNLETLFEKNLVKGKNKIKILGNGDIGKSLKVTASAFSKTAKEKIENAKGSVVVL